MSRFPAPSHAVAIGRTEIRRRYRVLASNGLQLVALVIAGLFLLAMSVALGFGAYAISPRFVGADVTGVQQYARWAAAGLFLGNAALSALRIVGEQGEIDHEAGMLTTVPHRDVVGGLAVAELVSTAAVAGVPVLALVVGVAIGTGSAALAASVLVAAIILVVAGLLAGQLVGYVLRYGFVRSEVLARNKTKLGIALFLAYMYFVSTQADPSAFLPVVEAVGSTPIGWVGLLPLAAVEGASLPLALAGAAAVVVAIPLLLLAVVAAAGAVWYADEVTPGSDPDVHEETSVDAGFLERIVGQSSAWVARTAWTRARRAPIKLVFVLYPAFGLMTPLIETIETGEVSPIMPVLLAVYGAWAAGAGFALNPLGDEGAMLPVTLTSGIPGHRFVRGLVTAAVVAGGVVVLPLVVGAAAFVPFPPVQTALLALATVVLLVGAGMLATGVGCAFPRFESVRISRSRRVVAPSLIAFAVYSFVLLVVAAPGMATQVPQVADAVASIVGLSRRAVQAGGVAATAALVGATGYASYRAAGREMDTRTL